MTDYRLIPIPVWIAVGLIVGLIVLAIVGYGAGLWEPALD
jgi:hypothetical protein